MIVGGVIVFVLAMVGVAAVRANLRPLDEIEETAEAIADGHLDRRVPERDPRTEIGRLGRSLNSMLSQIETAFHAREESEAAAHRSEERMRRFIADAGHELRTPLTAIRGFAEYYRQRGGMETRWDRGETPATGGGLTPSDLDRLMQRVEKEAARMGLLVEDLLLLARLDQQRPLARQPVDLLSLAGDAVHDARLLAPARTVDLSVQPGAAFLVIGDEPRLRQVIGNLMSNALTHTPDGTPIEVLIGSGTLDPRLPAVIGTESELREALTNLIFNAVDALPKGGVITLRTRAGAWSQGRSGKAASMHVLIEITDTGVGMDEETRKRCLEPFFSTKGQRGTGLGLAMVYGVVQRHDGTIEIESVPGKGTTFRLIFPVRETPRHDPGDSCGLSPAVPPLRVLFVDDEPLLRELLKEVLETDGHQVSVADGGQTALDLFRAARREGKPFDAVITVAEPNFDQTTTPPATSIAAVNHVASPPIFCNHFARSSPTIFNAVVPQSTSCPSGRARLLGMESQRR
jgi:two-component system OmpR family sensor kinase